MDACCVTPNVGSEPETREQKLPEITPESPNIEKSASLSVNVDVESGTKADLSLSSPSMRYSSYDRLSEKTNKILPKDPQDIRWSKIGFSANKKSILSDCWGKVESGKVCAIMGPSGAGKSSLLNVLAGRSSAGSGIEISGDVFVGDKKINPVSFRRNIAYVMQDDALMATATPREALEFSAVLRLPESVSSDSSTVKELVGAMLEELGLEDCADVMIGGPLIKGISGGQRKRTSVGVEIITNPSLLFLDEPTSGLDSYSAYNCVQLLRKVAAHQTTVLCTIHQPSSEIFYLFDSVIFMKSGRILYQGPVQELTLFLEKASCPCPLNYNPSDFIMFICQQQSDEELAGKGFFITNPDSNLPSSSSSSKVENSDSSSSLSLTPSPASFWKQMFWLSYRELINNKRDVGALIGRYGITIFLGILFGLIFLGAGGENNANPSLLQSHFGAVTFVVISSMFGSAQPVMLQFPFERPMFLREYSTGTYSATSYFLSKIIVELPVTLLQTVINLIICYFMIDMQGSWIYITLACWGLGLASSSVAVALGCAVANVKDVTEMAPLLFVPQLLFAGFFIRTGQIPIFLRWAQYLCGIKYAMNLILSTEFASSNPSCSESPEASFNCQQILESNNITPDLWWVYMLCLIALFVGFRLIGSFILIEKAKKFY